MADSSAKMHVNNCYRGAKQALEVAKRNRHNSFLRNRFLTSYYRWMNLAKWWEQRI